MRDKIDGILTEIDNVDQMTKALKKLMEDRNLRNFYTQNASERLKQMFDEKAVVDAYLKVFKGDFSD